MGHAQPDYIYICMLYPYNHYVLSHGSRVSVVVSINWHYYHYYYCLLGGYIIIVVVLEYLQVSDYH